MAVWTWMIDDVTTRLDRLSGLEMRVVVFDV